MSVTTIVCGPASHRGTLGALPSTPWERVRAFGSDIKSMYVAPPDSEKAKQKAERRAAAIAANPAAVKAEPKIKEAASTAKGWFVALPTWAQASLVVMGFLVAKRVYRKIVR